LGTEFAGQSTSKSDVRKLSGIEIFGREFEIFFEFIDGELLFPAISSRERLLR
jgi:hypothetical protein